MRIKSILGSERHRERAGTLRRSHIQIPGTQCPVKDETLKKKKKKKDET